jgi:raffinose/stachyose/melibiose transport system permease protein/xylobiose transport system permease protein
MTTYQTGGMRTGRHARPEPPGQIMPTVPARPRPHRRWRRNWIAGVLSTIWLAIVILPLYMIAVTSLRTQSAYLSEGAVQPPTGLTLRNYGRALRLGFGEFLVNSVIVAIFCIVLVGALALPAAYVITRGRSRIVSGTFSMYLLGLAIPAQAVIIPIYLIVTKLHLYDSLLAIILPSTAFSLPMSIVVLTSSLRDIPNELYEAMIVDGASPRRTFAQLVFPMARPGLLTIAIFSGLNAWNGILFPLVLTQSESRRVLPLGLWNFQGRNVTDVPGLMAAVVLSALPVLALYLFGRRNLLRALAAGFGR